MARPTIEPVFVAKIGALGGILRVEEGKIDHGTRFNATIYEMSLEKDGLVRVSIFAKTLGLKTWDCICVNCSAPQADDEELRYEAGPLKPITTEEAQEIRVIYFKLKFDYYLRACYCVDPLFAEIM